jgi:LDH2 family malate/lactate/ureidoglycolate dehydrogenase
VSLWNPRANRKLIRKRLFRETIRGETMADKILIGEKELTAFCEQVLTKLGVPAADARVTTEVLVLADLRGIDSHGVARLQRYVTGLREGYMKPTDHSTIVRETKATALIDGGQSLGQVVGRKGMELAIKKAKDTAVGMVVVRNSNHYGIAGYYSLMALEHGLIGISMTNAAPLVVPTFGRIAILGTNPISLTAPAMKERAFVLDMATSVVPRGKVEVYNRLGKPMPNGWAVDESGKSSTDSAKVLNALARRLGGGLLPLGGEGEEFSGHKGYGLALMVDVLCGVLPGAATGLQVYADETKPDVGHFFMAIDPAAFRPLDEFRRDMDRLAQELKDSPKAEGQPRIYVHGEKSYARMEKYRREGIPLGPKVVENLKQIGVELKVPWPGR